MKKSIIRQIEKIESNGGELEGASIGEIQAMEKKVGYIPKPLKSLFLICGRRNMKLFQGSDFGFEKLPHLRKVALEILGDSDREHLLESCHCVFMVHQGYEFFAATENEGGTDVLHYIEYDSRLQLVKGGFEEYIENTINTVLKYGS